LRVISESGGSAVSVTDEEIHIAIRELATEEGVYACPEGAATYAAYHNLILSGGIDGMKKHSSSTLDQVSSIPIEGEGVIVIGTYAVWIF
jgi:hypothetical protein